MLFALVVMAGVCPSGSGPSTTAGSLRGGTAICQNERAAGPETVQPWRSAAMRVETRAWPAVVMVKVAMGVGEAGTS